MRKGLFARIALQNIRKNGKIYYPYMLTAIVTVAMLYIICSLSRNESLKSDTVAFTLGLGVWVTTIFSVIFLFYTNSFLMKRRKKEFGLYNILGMEKKHIGRVVMCETFIMLFVSLALGFTVGILLDKLMYMLFMRMIGNYAQMSFYVSGYAIAFTSVIIGGTFLLILLNSVVQIYKAKPIELLRGGEVGEREPKAKWPLAVLGLIMLGAGYYISVKIVNPVAILLLFFVAVILVIIGTYLLFTAGSITLLKLMRKNKKYYYRADHFINVSGMIYRMKQNAVGLGNICILSTMVLVIVFSTVALWFGVDDMTNERAPHDISFAINNCADKDGVRAIVDEELKAAGLTPKDNYAYSYLSFAGYKRGDTYDTEINGDEDMFGDAITTLMFITLDDYNLLYGASETLEPDEIFVSSFRSSHPEDTLNIFDKSFRVKARFDGTDEIGSGFIRSNVYGTNFIVLSSQELLDHMDAKQREVYGKNAGTVRFYCGMNIDTSAENIIAVSERMSKRLKAQGYQLNYMDRKPVLREDMLRLYGGLFFIGLFLGLLFVMAMILIMYYKQISEGYDDQARYRIMRKVGLSRDEIKRSIGSQILTVFFLPLVTAGIHVAFAFPSISHMFIALGMTNVRLEIICALASFALFAVLYGIVYSLTARSYYKIVSAR